jgi:hypothetical protein
MMLMTQATIPAVAVARQKLTQPQHRREQPPHPAEIRLTVMRR